MTLIYTLALLYLLYLILFVLYKVGWNKVMQQNEPHLQPAQTFFSIIIPARNEAHQIGQTIHSILNNNYSKHLFEIIVVDDYSEDETINICQQIFDAHPEQQHKVLSLAQLIKTNDPISAFKKKALALGIEHTSGTHIITTDADCVVKPNWLHTFDAIYTQNPTTQFVIAPVNFTPANKKNSLYYLQSIDFMTMQGITAASYGMNIGNMCNGANLSFSKYAYTAVNGYYGIDNLASGDDMMLYNKIAKKFPNAISYNNNKEAIVNTPTQPDWASFINQRIRWASKNGKYNDYKLTSILLLVYVFNVLMVVASLYSLVNWPLLPYILGLWLLKIAAELLLVYPISTYFSKRNELINFILLQPFHAIYICMAGFLGLFKKYNWKGRVVK